jgi:hypothetical protein
LLKAQEELDALKQDLAHEKMERASAQADLDAAKNKKPDTSEVDALRKELQAIKDEHKAALTTTQQESLKATEEHLATKSSLEKTLAELDKQKLDAETRAKTTEADLHDLNDSMTQLVEEANKKAADLEARLKENEALLKVKDAELAEAKVCLFFKCTTFSINPILQAKGDALPSPNTPTTKAPEGLRASKFAEEDVDSTTTDVKSEAVEGEHDGSSAALASVREPSPNT